MARRPNDHPARHLGKRLIASLLAMTLATTPLASHPADLNAEMQAMFNDLGALGNVTTPGAFRGQAMNLYTGGSLMMRAPGRNYPLVQRAAAQPARRLRRHRPLRRRVLLHQQAAVRRPAAEHRRQRRGLRLQAGAAVDLARHRQAAHRAAGPDQQDQRDEHQLLRGRAVAGQRRRRRVRQLGA